MVERVNLNFSGFRPDIIEKVIRLLLILERIGNHAFLGSRMSLHGGTALNLFVLAMPRLSVDIDLSYVGNTDREQMLAERPAIEHAIADIARELGFTVTISPAEHSGRTFRLQYKGTAGLDSVKIDTNFLNRSPLLPLQRKTVVLDSPMLRHGIQEFHRKPLVVLPHRRSQQPDREALDLRYQHFLARA